MSKKYAVLVVDMLNDFVTGVIGCDRAKAIVKPLGELLDNARKNDIPVIFFNRELVEEDLMQWDRLYYVGADAFQSGILQGEMATEYFREHPEADHNGDGVIQYVVLEGEAGHQDAIIRTEYSVDTMISEGILLDKVG